ncbi:2-hydroxyacid dehydrogenase [Victivallis sp. Marseille-Q1083]|uniref:2-hydroxyacid dehydrogenase n=1 Tax=Victivallis sp. Marseille-Q1083 TaxID=2717288 RepID=UPI0020CA5713|nr:2-hydroxyacid dehydrogenase [Victivallis sp. Marseille-Q1083]
MKFSNIKIAFFDTKPYDRRFFEQENESFGFDIHFFEPRLNPDSVSMAHDYPVVCAFVNDNLGAATLEQLAKQKTKLIAMRCAGFNNVDLAAAHRHDITVTRVPAYSPRAVAEYTLGVLLTLNRSLHRAYNRVRDNNFSINGFLGFDIFDKTIGVIGTGKIGLTFIQILQGLGVHILASDPYPNQAAAAELHYDYVSLDELYARSDVISLHCPLTPDNQHMINRRSIAKMKTGVYIINTSRGKLIDTAALIVGLKKHKIGGAALDVYEEEGDYFYEDLSASAIADDILARLLTFPNVLVTSHQAFFTREALTNIGRITLQNIADFLEGKLTIKL